MALENTNEKSKGGYSALISKELKLERLHLRIVGDTIDVLYRPLHTYLWFLPYNDEGKARVKELALMSRQEFAELLTTVNALPKLHSGKILSILDSNSEEWYQKCWKVSTQKLLKEIGVDNPIEEPIWTQELEYIRHPELLEKDLENEDIEVEKGTIVVEDIPNE